MSEEEKEAILHLKKVVKERTIIPLDDYIEIILNLIDKLQKEVEDTKQTNANLKKEIKLMKSVNINENYISKDKIRNKIKELEVKNENSTGVGFGFAIYFLEELLGDDIDEN